MIAPRSWFRFIFAVSILGSTAFASTGISFAFYKAHAPNNPAWLVDDDIIIAPPPGAYVAPEGCMESIQVVRMPPIQVR